MRFTSNRATPIVSICLVMFACLAVLAPNCWASVKGVRPGQKTGTLANNTWYFAEGTTRPGFEEWLTLQNPGDASSHVTITFMMSDGYNQDKTLDVAGHSRTTLSVAAIIGPNRDASMKITSNNPVVAERPMYFSYKGVWNGGDCAIGATATATTWYFAEGTTRPGFDEYLCMFNPGTTQAKVHIEYMTPGSLNYFQDVTVQPRTRLTVKVADTVPSGQDEAATLTSDQPIVAERPMYYDFNGSISGGDNVVGATAPQKDWYFAEGYTSPQFWTYLCLQNPGDTAATARVYYLLAGGKVMYNDYPIGGKSRITVDPRQDIGEAEFSIVVDSSQAIVAERAMYFDYKGVWADGHNVVGASAPGKEVYFAEGTTLAGFEEYACIMNPNSSPAQVTFEIEVEGASPVTAGFTVAAHSRYTVNLNQTVGPNKNISIKATSDQAVVIERPMYFDYHGAWAGGSCVVGYMP